MWSYYGSKYRLAPRYPKPRYNKIIEPFAGAAQYSLRHFERDVLLVDKYPVIIRIWRYLQQCSKKDILSLPNLSAGTKLDDLEWDCPEQRELMGFMIGRASRFSRNTVSSWGRYHYISQREKIANDLFKIRHWKFRCCDYSEIENEEATWFIDPPYQFGGESYAMSSRKIDYKSLANWCKSRKGQVMVCENDKSDWLPWRVFGETNGVKGKTTEVIWTNDQQSPACQVLLF